MSTIPHIWHCDCGAVEIEITPPKGTRALCYCRDCQAFLRHLDRLDLTDHAGGTDLFQTTANSVRITRGDEKLAALRLSSKGPIRWYTSCCSTPMCNTGASRALPLASFTTAGFKTQSAIGPVQAHVNLKGATAHVENPVGSLRALIVAFLPRALKSLFTGAFRKSPFFDDKGRAKVKPKRLSEAERAAAYAG